MTAVSVILPVYNTEEYLGECLDSLLTQKLEDIEIICVDDGSQDDSLSTLQGYAFLDARLKVISIPHSGVAVARNKALSEAKGKYIYFANSYDIFDENMLAKMVQKAETDKSDIVIEGYNILNQTFKEITGSEKLDEKLLNQSPCTPQDLSDELFITFPNVVWNKLIRADLIHKFNLTFEEELKYCTDQAFNAMVLAASTKISVMDECLFCHRININPYQKKEAVQEFEDKIKSFSNLYYQMEKSSLLQDFDGAYYIWLKKCLCAGLDNLSTNERGIGLKSILTNLPQQVVAQILSPSKYEQKISIIIPVYNAAEFLPECLDSCLNQTLKEIEIICVDDGSTDNSLHILKEYAQKDARIKVMHQANLGRTIARNNAMEVASGTFIQFLDADDYLESNACEMLYTYAKLYALDMLSFSAIEFNHKTKAEFEEPYHTLSWLPEKFPSVFNWKIMATDMAKLSVTACLTLYRRMFLLKNDITWMNKKVVFEDTPFFTEAVFKDARMGTLKLPFYHRRIHSEATTQNMSTYFHDLIFIYKHTLKMLKRMNVSNPIIGAYADVFFNKVYQNYLHLDIQSKEKETTTIYNFCLYMLKKYHLHYSKELLEWIHVYLKSKKFKKKLTFQFYWLYSQFFKNHYTIPLLEYQKGPTFKIKLFAIPIIEIQIKKIGLYTMSIKIFGCPLLDIKEIQKY